MSLKVAFNCWVLRNKNYDGIGYFTINTISRIIKNHPSVEFLILCDKNFSESYFDYPNAKKYYLFPALRHPVLYVFYMEFFLPLFLKKHKPDIFVSPDGFLSLLSRTKQIPVIHDINFEHYPEGLAWKNRIYYRFFFKRFAHKAQRIVTVSTYSKKEIANYYSIDENKIDVVYNAPNGNFRPLTEPEIAQVRGEFSEGKPYFFFIGSIHPRKNMKRLIESFSIFKKDTGVDYKLLIAGAILWGSSEIEPVHINSNYKDDIIFLGRVTTEKLQMIMGAAFALSFVPVFEGFGVPVIEAMQAGVPVIVSNVTSLPEVAGNAALFVDPFNIESIADGMKTLYSSDLKRKQLIGAGFVQQAVFTWDSSAALLWQSIQRCINEM